MKGFVNVAWMRSNAIKLFQVSTVNVNFLHFLYIELDSICIAARSEVVERETDEEDNRKDSFLILLLVHNNSVIYIGLSLYLLTIITAMESFSSSCKIESLPLAIGVVFTLDLTIQTTPTMDFQLSWPFSAKFSSNPISL